MYSIKTEIWSLEDFIEGLVWKTEIWSLEDLIEGWVCANKSGSAPFIGPKIEGWVCANKSGSAFGFF